VSLIVFGAAAAEFVLWPKFGTSTYFLLTALSLVDFLSGGALRTGAARWRRCGVEKSARKPTPVATSQLRSRARAGRYRPRPPFANPSARSPVAPNAASPESSPRGPAAGQRRVRLHRTGRRADSSR